MNKNGFFKSIMLTIMISLGLSFSSYAAEKDYTFEVEKEYQSAVITIDLPMEKADLEYKAIIYSSDKKSSYEASYIDDDTLSCVVNDTLKKGTWSIHVETVSAVIIKDDVEVLGEEEATEDNLKGIKIKFEGSMEKSVDVTKDIKTATDIAGLKMYFKDDDFVAEWTDSSCGNVNIEITNADNNQTLFKKTIQNQKVSVPLEDDVAHISVKLVPSVSANVEGAAKQYSFTVDNHPDAVVTYEDIRITNRNSIEARVQINQPYSIVIWANGKEVEKTKTLEVGSYTFNVPTEVGSNEYLIYVVDEDGNMRSTRGSVEKDVIAPVLQLSREFIEIETEEESITFDGKVEDYDYFTINDTMVTVEGDHTFQYEYHLKEGYNVIEIVAGDEAGNTSSYIATIERIVPIETPIPWVKIIAIAIIVVLGGLYVFDIIRKNMSSKGEKENESRNRKEKKSGVFHGKKKHAVKKPRGVKGIALDLIDLLVPIICVYILFSQVIEVSVIQSGSMEPTLMTGDTIFVNRLAYIGDKEIQRGDIVTFWSEEHHQIFGKRVIGIPGDVIEFKDGYVVINGQYTDESNYIADSVETNSSKKFEVPAGKYFLLGDNREKSLDSRFWVEPYISGDAITGRYMGKIDFSFQYDIVNRFFG